MEANDMLMTSITAGGIVFVAFLLIWFVGSFLKKRARPEAETGGLPIPGSVDSWDEKRSAPRLALAWHATLTTQEASVPVQLKDIGQGGAFAACKAPLKINEVLRLSIDLPNAPPLALNARVVWSNAGVPADKIVNRGMGIRFIENDEASRKRLKTALADALALSKTAAL